MNILSTTTGNAAQLSMMQEMNRMKTLADAPVLAAQTITSSAPASEVSFHQVMGSALNHIDRFQQIADAKQNDVDMGKSDDLVGAMLASQQASLSFSALVQVRNKVASGVNDLMNMSI
ncbi:flagellar hook-basal body complex protein FliE [Superficieibacter sp.]|uniref:flagellar hook-basal body complex protein FliE n=1 Tax=Superficieibacter sp. TaxID=2303322 RepID=UPI0028A8BC42|nr:flagellar hook-basal body complex protein FliE [Superficieibacter sp.]